MTLVLIEDNDELRVEMSEYFRRRGRTVCACENLAKARELLAGMSKSVPPEAIILDAHLPDGSGVAFCVDMQTNFPRGPWILISGGHDIEEIDKATAAGVRFILLDKPVSMRKLNQLLTEKSATSN